MEGRAWGQGYWNIIVMPCHYKINVITFCDVSSFHHDERENDTEKAHLSFLLLGTVCTCMCVCISFKLSAMG